MNLSEKPVLFALLSAAVISVGTLVTTFLPLFLPSTQPVSPQVTPYAPVELEGRDIYLREGCNNCHTQTVRPLRTEVARYGDYSKPEEFAYDRPFLWGSRRTGPDLARIGGKYPDSWHYQHNANPQGMFPESNMPAYGWLASRPLATDLTARKIRVLGYGPGAEEVAAQLEGYRRRVTAADSPSAAARNAVTPEPLRGRLTEMDALVAYLQKLGRDLSAVARKEISLPAAAQAAEARNPFAGKADAVAEGERIYRERCEPCHGEKGAGGFGPNLADAAWGHGSSDADLYAAVSKGLPGGMPPFEAALGPERIWKAIAYLRTLSKP